MMYPIFDGPRVRAIAMEVNSVSSELTRFSRPYQPVLRAIILVLDICVLLAVPVLQISVGFNVGCSQRTTPGRSLRLVAYVADSQRHTNLPALLAWAFGPMPPQELDVHPSIVQLQFIEHWCKPKYLTRY